MKEENLIEEEPEPRSNNNPVVVNELETKLLNIATEEELGRQLGCGCRMNNEIATGEKEISYRCPNCPNRMKNICLFCLQNCHKSHINKLPADLFKNDLVNFEEVPCECALHNHNITFAQKKVGGTIEEEKENLQCCPFNKLFACIKPKYVYRRRENGKIYCLFCINNFTVVEDKNSDKEEEGGNRRSSSLSSDKGSKVSFGSLLRQSIDKIEAEERRTNAEKENVSNDVDFYEKYEKVEVDYTKPFPNCECVDELHKHKIVSENIDNLYNYMMNIVERNKLNLDKLAYHIFNDKLFSEILFAKFFQIHDFISNKLKDIESVDTSIIKRNFGSEENILTSIDFDDKADWEVYHKTTKLFELASKRLKVLNFFNVPWLNDKIKKYFSFKSLCKLLLCKSNYEEQLFKVQLFSVKIYRRAFLTNIPPILLINENTSFINRQLYNSPITTKANESFDEGYKITENIFYLLDMFCDDPKIDPKDYNELFVEAIKIFKVIISYKTNDVSSIMSLFRKIKDNISNVKEKKENQNRIVHNLEILIEKIFSYFNDNKFLHNVKDPKNPTQFQYAFLSSSEYNKEILSTLFNFDIEINEMNPYIDSDGFYDTLVSEKDSYAESIENFLNATNDWKRKVNKDFTDLLHGQLDCQKNEEVSNFFKSITMNLKGLLTNQLDEKQFLSTSNQLINNLSRTMQTQADSFTKQVNFVQNKYYFKIMFLLAIEQRLTKFTLNAEEESSKEKQTISSITNEINKNLRNLMISFTKDNPLTCSILFNKIVITLLLQDNFDDLLLYYELLKVMKNNSCKINTAFLTTHIHSTYCENLNLKEKENEIILLLKVYELILLISSDKSVLQSNNIIALDLKYILENKDFEKKINSLSDKNEEDFVEKVFHCLHCLQSEYFYIINPFIDIKKITIKLKDDRLKPNIRLVFTEIYTDYFLKNYFSTITIEKMFESENLITSNLVENLDITFQQKQFQEYLSNFAKKITSSINTPNPSETEEKMKKIMHAVFDNLEKYRYYHNMYIEMFNKSFSLAVSYFKNVILYPTLYSIYKLTYFPRKYTSPQKYDLYKLIFLYLQCYQYFINEIVTRYNLADKENADIWSEFAVPSANIDEMRKKVDESVKNLSEKSGKVLDMKLLFHHFFKNSKDFIEIKEKFLEKDEEEKEENDEDEEEEDEEFLLTYGSLKQDMNLFKRLRKEYHHYMDMKKEFEGNNVFDDIFQDEQLDLVQQEISFDLLYKLSFKRGKHAFRKQEKIGYIYQNDLVRGREDVKKIKPPNPFSNLRRKGMLRQGLTSVNALSSDRTDKYGDYYNPYLSNFIESKTIDLEIVDKCFKSNPSFWQEQVVEMSTICRDLIFIFITNQLPFLIQFAFMEFNKIDTKDSSYYANFLNILEFLRLLCEDHNPLFQTMLINYEKAIGKASLFSNESNQFIPFISRIPVFVLLNIKHCLSKEFVLQGFVRKSTDYFNPLIEKITDFLIEIIQGTYPDNFNDLTTSLDEISRLGLKDYIKKHYQFLDYLDTDSSYEPAINNFFRFFNCFVEENANPLTIKAPIMNIFHPKKLINVSINEFKKCVNKYIDKNITEECSEKLTQHYIKDYDIIKDDSSFSLSLTIFLYFKRANSFKEKTLGDKYQQILDALKELYDEDEELEENSNLLLRREYYQFCSMMIKETEISFTEDKKREDKEIYKYRNFFSKTYMREVIEFRNRSCAKTQNLVNQFFLVHPDSLYFKQTDTDLFLEKASYDNFNAKLTCIINYYPEINQIIEMRKTIKTPTMLKLCQINYGKMEYINAVCSILTNCCLGFRTPDSFLDNLMIIFAIIHIVLLSLLILNWFVFNCIKELKKPKESSPNFLVLCMSIFNYEILPFTWTLIFGVLAVSDEKLRFLFSLQLFPIFTLFDTMKSVLEAVKVRYNQFLSTGFLLVILILFYAAVTFYFFRFDNNGNELCTTYLHCFVYLFNSGIRSGGVPFEIKILGQEGFWGEFIYSWVFYFIVILIILNIVNGIIVDKFQDLREKNNEIYEEKENVCYICSLHRSNFEIKGIDFEYHQQHEHNISNYFHYLLKINRTDEHDLNSIDFQVYNAFKQRKIEFFPIKKAISLENTNI